MNSEDSGGNDLITTARSFTNLIWGCDGTKKDLLNNWDSYCNAMKKPLIQRLLSDYKDKQDKANSVFQNGGNSVFAKSEKGAWDTIKDFL